MRERPILFSAPMVRAILAGTKTQTRRIIKPQPASWIDRWGYTCFTPVGSISGRGNHPEHGPAEKFYKIPYGTGPTPKRKEIGGGRLWVREKFAIDNNHASDEYPKLIFAADGTEHDCDGYSFCPTPNRINSDYPGNWRPSIHMPRWASRISLDVTNIRVERLQDITEDDAKAEGVTPFPYDPEGDCWTDGKHRTAFEYLWDQLNRERAPWSSNPWVWVVEFKRAESQVTP